MSSWHRRCMACLEMFLRGPSLHRLWFPLPPDLQACRLFQVPYRIGVMPNCLLLRSLLPRPLSGVLLFPVQRNPGSCPPGAAGFPPVACRSLPGSASDPLSPRTLSVLSPSHAALSARRDCRGRQKEPSPGLCRKRALFIMKLCSCFLFPVSLLRDTVPSLLCPQQLTFRSSAWPWISTSFPPAGRSIVSPRKKRRDSCLPSSSS